MYVYKKNYDGDNLCDTFLNHYNNHHYSSVYVCVSKWESLTCLMTTENVFFAVGVDCHYKSLGINSVIRVFKFCPFCACILSNPL